MKNYLIPFSKQNILNKSGVNFPNGAFWKLIDVRRGSIKLDAMLRKRKYQGKNEPLACVNRSAGKTK